MSARILKCGRAFLFGKKAEPEIKLSQNEEKYLNELADGIKDEKLKEILTKLGKSVVLSNRGEK